MLALLLPVIKEDVPSSSTASAAMRRRDSEKRAPPWMYRCALSTFDRRERRSDDPAPPDRQPFRVRRRRAPARGGAGGASGRYRDAANDLARRSLRDRAVGTRRRGDLRARRRRDVQRGAERRRGRRAARLSPGRRDERAPACPRAPAEPRAGGRGASPRGAPVGSGSGASTAGDSASTPGLGFDAELVRRVDELGRSPDGRRPGDVAFIRVAASVLREHRARFDEQLEIDGAGRAAFVLVANCSPYTYSGSLALDLVPGASFDEGLAYFAPVSRARARPAADRRPRRPRIAASRTARHSPRTTSTASSSAATSAAAPGRRRGRRRRRRGRLRGRARRGDGARLTRYTATAR